MEVVLSSTSLTAFDMAKIPVAGAAQDAADGRVPIRTPFDVVIVINIGLVSERAHGRAQMAQPKSCSSHIWKKIVGVYCIATTPSPQPQHQLLSSTSDHLSRPIVKRAMRVYESPRLIEFLINLRQLP
jgi:hypothetical protein